MRLYHKLFLYFFAMIFILLGTITFVQYQRERSSHADQLDGLLDTYNVVVHNFIQNKNFSRDELEQIVLTCPF